MIEKKSHSSSTRAAARKDSIFIIAQQITKKIASTPTLLALSHLLANKIIVSQNLTLFCMFEPTFLYGNQSKLSLLAKLFQLARKLKLSDNTIQKLLSDMKK